ncbi:MAG: hypothetical protein EXS08_11530 [Planctomycetes bacterium]|nr:hypothetical protein [Planctomycetota bacterium]
MLSLAWFALTWLQVPAPQSEVPQSEVPQSKVLESRPLLDAGAALRDLALDARGKRVFTLSDAGELKAWSTHDGQSAWSLEARGAWAVDAAGEGLLLTMATPSVLRVEAAAGALGATLAGPSDLLTLACAVDPHGAFAWVGVPDGLVQLAPGLEKGWSHQELDNEGVTALALDAAGAQLAVGGHDGSLRFADAHSGELDYKRVLRVTPSPVTALAFAPKLLVAANEDRSLRVLNLASGQVKLQLKQDGAPVRLLAVAAKAGWFASGDGEGNVLVWQLAQGTVLAHWSAASLGALVALAFAPDEKTLYAAAGQRVLALDLGPLK